MSEQDDDSWKSCHRSRIGIEVRELRGLRSKEMKQILEFL